MVLSGDAAITAVDELNSTNETTDRQSSLPQMKVACVNVTAVQCQKHQYEIGYEAGFSSNNLHIQTVKVRQ